MKKIPLSNSSRVAHVSDRDFRAVARHKWWLKRDRNGFYAITRIGESCVRMHRMILGTKKQVDHKDCDGLNNTRRNIRPCTNRQNQWNRRKFAKCSSPFKGVSFSRSNWKWVARISVNGIRISLGSFAIELDAARAYNAAAKKYFGEFSRTNDL